MANWSHSVLAGFDRAIHGIRGDSHAPRSAPAPTHAFEIHPAIGFAALASGEGCRFEVHRRSLATGEQVQLDLNHPDVASLTWTIKVANRKAGRGRTQILDPGIQTLSGRGLRVDLARPDGAPMRDGIRSLGVATTDAAGNLIVFAADDDCDGWVRAELRLRSGTRILAARIANAWFVAASEFTLPVGRIDPDEHAPGWLTGKQDDLP